MRVFFHPGNNAISIFASIRLIAFSDVTKLPVDFAFPPNTLYTPLFPQ
ncbi:hypothetical protein LM500704_180006 [Listeria monocytogenes]|nr:hypothetical protein LM500704_180006 [Listeria monocytogenes]CUM03938.1 hypothetical protein LM900402_270005 [Listeria monocytogenes]